MVLLLTTSSTSIGVLVLVQVLVLVLVLVLTLVNFRSKDPYNVTYENIHHVFYLFYTTLRLACAEPPLARHAISAAARRRHASRTDAGPVVVAGGIARTSPLSTRAIINVLRFYVQNQNAEHPVLFFTIIGRYIPPLSLRSNAARPQRNSSF